MISVDQNWSMRDPWPDEETRLRRHFSPTAAGGVARPMWSQVVVAGNTERIVGLAELHPVANPAASAGRQTGTSLSLYCEIRPAWREHPAAVALFDAALAQASAAHVDEVVLTVQGGNPLVTLARARGFVSTHRRERWSMPVGDAREWFERRGKQAAEESPVFITPITQASLAWVRDTCVAAQLLTAERVVPTGGGHAGGFDENLSFIANVKGVPQALLLAREQGGTVYLEALIRARSAKEAHLAAVLALLRAFFCAAQASGHTHISCEITPERTPGLMRMLVRGRGACISVLESLSRRG